VRPDHIERQQTVGQSKIGRISGLALSLFLIWFFLYVVGPWLSEAPMVKPLMDVIEANDIDAGAYYYTEIEEFSEADVHMNNSRDYPSR